MKSFSKSGNIKKSLPLIILIFIIGLSESYTQVRFQDDFEETYNPNPSNKVYDQWYKSGWNDGGYIETTNEIIARHGLKSLKVVMVRNTDGKSRTETGVNLANSLGNHWYGFSIYIPDEIDFSEAVTDGNWYTVLAQWGVWLNNPGLPDFALRMNERNFLITYEPSTGSPITLLELPLRQGRWVDWVFHIDWTRNSDGIFQVWQDGNKVLTKLDFQTTDGDGADVKSKIGLYYAGWGERSSSLNSIYCYYDSYKIAKGEDELLTVAPWAAGSTIFAPSALEAQAISISQIELHWSDNSANEIGFNVEREINGEFQNIATLDSNITSYLDTGLTPSTNYRYRISAFSKDSIIGYSNICSLETFTIGGIYQEKDSTVSIEAEHGQLGAFWEIVNNDFASNGKTIKLDTSKVGSTSQIEGRATTDGIASFFFNIKNPGKYKFWYRTLDSEYSDISFYWRINDGDWLNENNQPTGNVWQTSNNSIIELTKSGNYILEVGYNTKDIQLDKFVIQSYNYDPITNYGPLESNGTGIFPPIKPSNLIADAVSQNQISLMWEDNSNNEEGFNIFRKSIGTSYWQIGKVDSNTTSYLDSFLLNPSTIYTYKILAYNSELNSNYSNISLDTTLADPTGISNNIEIPAKLILMQNYPNPANPSTVIDFSIPVNNTYNNNSTVQLVVYDALGNLISTLIDESMPPGNYSVEFDTINLTSGVYFYQLKTALKNITRKLLIIK